MTKNPFSDNCWQNSVSQYSIDTVAPATKRIAGFFLFPKLSVQSSMPFVLIIFSFISVFLCLQLIIISPKINIQSSFFFIYQCLTVMLVSFTMPANGHVYEMFGNSKHYSVQPLQPYKPTEMTNKPLTAKYFIYDVTASPLFYYFLALPLRFGNNNHRIYCKNCNPVCLLPFSYEFFNPYVNIFLCVILALRFLLMNILSVSV